MNKKLILFVVSLLILAFAVSASASSLTVGMSQEPVSLDPAAGLYIPEQFIIQQIYDPLIYADPDLELHPALATEWSVNEEGTEFSFTLREGVKFHDGTDFTAEAVKVSFDRAAEGKSVAAASPALLAGYAGTEVVDDHHVVVKFTTPHATFLQDLTRPWLMISSPAAIEKYGDSYARNPIGTGPFIFKEWVAQEYVTVTKNEDYNWAPDFMNHQGPAYLDEVTFRFLPEAATRLTAFEAGEAQIVQDPSYLEASFYADDPNASLYTFSAPGMTSHQMINTEKAPTDDINVRKAMIYAVDQEQISQTAFYGLQPPAHSLISPSTWGFSQEADDMYRYDPEKAAELLEASGWVDSDGDGIREKDGEKLHLEYPALPAYEEAFMELLAYYFSKVGFEVSITQLDDAGVSEWGYNNKHNIINMGWVSRDPSVIDYTYNSANIEGGTESSYTRFRNEHFDELLNTAPQTIDADAREAMYQEIQVIAMENALLVPVHCYGSVYLTTADVENFRFDPEGFPYMYEITSAE
ncbi:MAG: ABC transporter substrate-binding protein [Anaerolineaceae bacterium]|nr:ABC transporter substrate-binding protein [Anaerolineaceae bacterium]